jgi:hypothetical protein
MIHANRINDIENFKLIVKEISEAIKKQILNEEEQQEA